jgi:predicted ATPase
MNPVIRSLTLKGFRSFALERIQFDNPTFLVGQNGSGKTTLIDALTFIHEAMRHPLEEVIRKRGGMLSLIHRSGNQDKQKRSFALKVALGGSGLVSGHYSIEIQAFEHSDFEVVNEQFRVVSNKGESWFNRTHGACSSSIPGLQPFLNPHGLVLPLLGGLEPFRPIYMPLYYMIAFRPQIDLMRQPQKVAGADHLTADWSNAGDVLLYLQEKSPESLERISEILSTVTPVPVHVRPRVTGGMVSLEFEQQNSGGSKLCFNAAEMSDGTLRVLGFLLAVFQRSFSTLLVFEKPESKVSHRSLGVVSDLLRAASDENQILVTTHSPEFLDAKWITDRHIRIAYWEAGASKVSLVGKASRETLQERLMGAGELLRSNVLDNPPIRRVEPEEQLFEVFS